MSEDKISLPVEDQRLLDKALLRSTQYVYDIPPAPAAMPNVEEIKDLLLRFHADTASAWRHERDGIATSAARAILDLFAPILAEKERGEADARVFKINATSKLRSLEARALAAEAALASAREEERERCAALADSLDPNATDIAAAIRAQGSEMLGDGFNTPSNSEWRPVMSPYGGLDTPSPYDYDRVEIRRGHDGEILAVDFRKLPQVFNVAGLYWRPVNRNGRE